MACSVLSLSFVLVYITLIAASPFPRHGHLRRASELNSHYDYIIVGGGTSGLTVADRLSAAFPQRSVLVVEYGDLSNSTEILRPSSAVFDPNFMFDITSVPQPGLGNRSFTVTVGKVVGGSSAINAQIFDRGSKADYDAWSAVSMPFTDEYEKAGWNWEGLLPYFRKSVQFMIPSEKSVEDYGYTYDVEAAWGGNSSIYASYPPFQWPTTGAVRDAFKQLGVPVPKEAQAGDAYGLIWFPSSQDPRTATRSYARTGHYDPAAGRSNYHLSTKHKVTKVMLNRGLNVTARSVQIRPVGGNSTFNISSDREIILATGAVHTPQILQLSGIGPSDILGAAGIETIVDLPGVGQNFHDHAITSVFCNRPFTLSGGNAGAFLPLRTISSNWSAITTRLTSQDPSTHLPSITSDTVLSGYASLMKVMGDLFSSKAAGVMEYPVSGGGFTIPTLLKPLSRGSVNINPENLGGEPLVDYRTFSNPIDLAVAIAGVRILRKLWTMPSFQKLGPTEIIPGLSVQTDADFAAWLRQSTTPSFFHPAGTAALMPREAGGVVGPDLKVHGVEGLRIVDASNMPMLPGTHPSSTVFAVAEKAADIIMKDNA